ncbi:hypothetical protein HY439_02870 [Candidatus Microgenomates bacterium]|nr:hypothetical protein [Candidatus Microgenomates bacterium]
MPIQAPISATTAAAGEFKDTTAAYRKTGPVEKYPPSPAYLKTAVLNGLAPIAPRVNELTREGKMVTTTALRAAEVAAKAQRGENLSPTEIAQALIATREALDAGLADPNSPFYQQDTALRTQRENELKALHDELNGFLTQETRRPEDMQRVDRLWGIPGIRITRTWQAVDTERPLTTIEINESSRQSRITESYENVRDRIIKERFGGRPFAALNPAEKRQVVSNTSEELSRQFDDGRVQALLEQVRQGPSEDLIADALEHGTDAEKRLARRAQKIEDDREAILKKAPLLNKIKKMDEFQRFLGVDDTTLSQTEIADAMIKKLGVFDEREIARLKSDPDRAFKRFYQEADIMGTTTFVGELLRGKLESFAENRGVEPKPEERIAGQAPEKLSREALIGLTPSATAMRLVDNWGERTPVGDPVAYLKGQGVPEDQAKKMVEDAEKLVIKNADGSYSIDHDKLGEWHDEDLVTLGLRGTLDLTDPAVIIDLRTKMDAALTSRFPDAHLRGAELDKRIANIKDLARIYNATLPPDEIKKIVHKWDRYSLALLTLLIPLLMGRVVNQLEPHEQRTFQNMFA